MTALDVRTIHTARLGTPGSLDNDGYCLLTFRREGTDQGIDQC